MQVDEPLRQENQAQEHSHDRTRPASAKTEIAGAWRSSPTRPFVKVEATKFTELGYVGRDVDSIVKDLADVAVKITREQKWPRCVSGPLDAAEESVLDTPPAQAAHDGFSTDEPAPARDGETRQKFRKMLREHELDDREIEIELRPSCDGVDNMRLPAAALHLHAQHVLHAHRRMRSSISISRSSSSCSRNICGISGCVSPSRAGAGSSVENPIMRGWAGACPARALGGVERRSRTLAIPARR